jgi:predicted O-methyltransferase YrrM
MHAILNKARTAGAILSFARKARAAHALDLDSLIELTFQYGFVSPIQVPWELATLLKVIGNLNCRTFLEIGTHRGGAFFAFCQVSSPSATVISMDLPVYEAYGRKPPYREFVIRAMAQPGQTFGRILGDSHSEESFARLQRKLRGRKLDFLFIDGDHSYQGVRRDFEMYAPLVRQGGILGFHDIVQPVNDPSNEVHRFWGELKSRYEWSEIVASPCPGWGGIGYITL